MTIGVFFGSRSPEHDISIITGQLIIAGLKKLGHFVVPIYLNKQGRWFLGTELGEMKTFTTKDLDFSKFSGYSLDLELSRNKLVFRKNGVFSKTITVDLAFPALHGANGEDGTIQGLFEMFNVPYVGCGVATSAIAMDKVITKKMLVAAGIPTAPFKSFTKNDWDRNKINILGELESEISYPVVIKPSMLGSSIGITKVNNSQEAEQAIETALYYGNTVLAEKAVENLVDLTCAVLGNDDPKASLVQESKVGADLLSFEDKYLKDGGTQLGKAASGMIIPARIDAQLTESVRNTAVEVFKALDCRGIARVDFLLDNKAGKYYVSEVNTLPGTLYHHLWAQSGLSLEALLTTLIQLSEEDHMRRNRFATVFESDLLKMAGGIKGTKLK